MEWPRTDIDSLLQWWDECVFFLTFLDTSSLTRSIRQIFPESALQPMAKRADGALSIAQRMVAQAKLARQAREDEAAACAESQS